MATIRVDVIGSAKDFKAALGDAVSSTERANGAFSKMGAVARGVGRGLAIGVGLGGAAAAVGLKKSIDAAGEFQASLNVLKAVTGGTNEQMAKASKLAIALGNDAKLPAVSAKDAADSMLELGKAGLTVVQSMKAARATLLLATAAETDNATAAKVVAQNLQAFHLSAKSASTIVDQMAGVMNNTGLEFVAFADSLSYTAAISHTVGQAFDDTATQIAILARSGIEGSMAGTALRTILSQLGNESSKASVAMKKMGVTTVDTHGNFVGMRSVIDQLAPSLDKMTRSQKLTFFQTNFGKYAMAAANIVLGEHASQYDKVKAAIDRKGQADRLAASHMKGYTGAIAQLSNALQTLEVNIGLKVLPVATRLARFLANVASSPNISVAIHVALQGIASLAANVKKTIGDALFGSSKVVHIGGGSPHVVVDPGLIAALQAAISAGVASTDWGAVGQSIGNAISKAIKISSNAIEGAMSTMMDWVSSHKGQIADIGLVIGLTMLSKLLDPGFWIAHWQLIGGLALSAITIIFPEGKLAQVGVKAIGFLLKPFELIGSKLAALGVEGVLGLSGAIERAVGPLGGRIALWIGDAILRSVSFVVSAMVSLGVKIVAALINKISGLGILFRTATFTAIVTVIGSLIGSAVSKAEDLASAIANAIKTAPSKLVGLAGDLLGKIGPALKQVASWAVGAAEEIGRAIAEGVVRGTAGLPGHLVSSLMGAVTGALAKTKAGIGAHSPSTLFAVELGMPIGEGIISGFLLGSASLPDKMSAHLRSSLNTAKNVVTSRQAVLTAAFAQLGEDVGKAFDAATSAHLTANGKRFDAWRAKATKALSASMGTIDKAASGLTPSEQALADLQGGHDQAGRNSDLAKGQADLAAATTPEEQAAAQKEIDDAVYNQRIFDLGVLAAAERAAKDAAAEVERQKVQAAYDQQNTAWDAQQAKEDLNYQAARDLQKRHLDAKIAALETQLEKNPSMFAKHHSKLMKWLEDVAGPDMKESGKNLGVSFAKGLAESIKEVNAAGHSLALELQKFLKLSSPAEKGPLSDLDTWWKPLGATLLSGVDTKMISGVTNGMSAPALSTPSAYAASSAPSAGGVGGGGGVTVIVNGWVGNDQDIAEKIRNTLIRTGRTTTGGALGGFA